MDADLIDRIYECAVVPELWPRVLDDVAAMSQSRGGLLFSARRSLHWTASATVEEIFDSYVKDGWFTRCSRRVCLMSQTQPAFFVEHDFWTEEDMANDPIYRDFFRPRGLGWSAGTGLRLPTGDNIVFSIERDFARGPIERAHVDRLDALRPHLARSAFVTTRLGLQRAQGATEALTALRLPALLLDASGRVIEANALTDGLTDLIVWGADDRLLLTDQSAGGLLAAALAQIDMSPCASPRSFPVRDADGAAAMIAHVLPIRRSAHDIFSAGFALLMLTPVAARRGPSPDLMRSLFDLTPSEARVPAGSRTERPSTPSPPTAA